MMKPKEKKNSLSMLPHQVIELKIVTGLKKKEITIKI